ncbi:DUF3137 domain-containing protein [Actinophytocola sp.]|uniref:DUF3137 domain-containing protein n=1 Tax=Actinophytocola sp. TaxID=1872138 RepID=UPI002ED2D26A
MELWAWALLVAAVIGALWYFQRLAHKKKVAEFTAYAAKRGWRYREKDHELADRFTGRPFGIGHGRRVTHVLRGSHRDRDVLVFQYTYKETTGAGDERKTEIYHRTVAALPTPAPRPTLEVTRKGLGRKLLDVFGGRGLRLDSEEFNKTFVVETEDETFARDVLGPGMVEWLLSDYRPRTIPFRFERADLLVWRPGEINLSAVDELADYVCDILDRTPSFVWKP